MKETRKSCVHWLLQVITLAVGLSLSCQFPAHAAVDGFSWSSQQDFESNAQTTGEATTRSDLDTQNVSGDVMIGPPLDRIVHPVLRGPSMGSAVNTRDHKVYAVGQSGGNSDTVSVYDQASGELRKFIKVGSFPLAAAYNSINNTIFTANWQGRTVSVIDCATDEVIRTIPVGSSPRGIVFNPDHNKIYVTNQGSGTVSIIDGATYALRATVTLAAYGGGTAPVYNANAKVVYVTGSGGIAVIDGATDQLINTMPVGKNGYAMAYNSMRNRLVVTYEGYVEGLGTPVVIIDCATQSVLKTLYLGSADYGAAYNSVNNKVYVASGDGSTVYVLNGDSDQVTKELYVSNPRSLTYDPTTNMLIAGGFSSSLTHFDGATDQALRTVNTALQATSVAYAAASERLYVTGAFDKRVYVVDPSNYSIIKSVVMAHNGDHAVYNHLNNKVYVAHPSANSISVIDCATSTVSGPFPVGLFMDRLILNDALNKIYAVKWNGTVAVFDCQTQAVSKTFSTGKLTVGGAFATASNRLFLTNRDHHMVTVVDGANDTVLQTVAVGSEPIGAAYDSNRNLVYVGSNSFISIIDAATLSQQPNLPSQAPYQLGYNPFTDRLYATSVYDMNTESVTSVYSGSTRQSLASFSHPSYGEASYGYSQRYNKTYISNDDAFFEVTQYAQTGTLGGEGAGKVGLRIAGQGGQEVTPLNLKWNHAPLVATQKIRFQIKTANDAAGLAAATYLGPDGTSGSWYEAATAGASTTDEDGGLSKTTSVPLSGNANFSFQLAPFKNAELQMMLVSDGKTPAVHSVTLEYEQMDPPSSSQLAQYKADGVTSLTGSTKEAVTLSMSNITGLTASTSLHAEFEVKPVAAEFDGSGVLAGSTVAPEATSKATFQPSAEGDYKWRARIVDQAGRRSDWTGYASGSRAFAFDTTAPALAVNAVTLQGTTEALAGISVTAVAPAVAGPVTYQGETLWSCTISNLVQGGNSVTIHATDEAGNMTSVPLVVNGTAVP